MSFKHLVDDPCGSEDIFIFNTEFLLSRKGVPYLRFDVGLVTPLHNIVIRQVRLSGGVLRPPQVKIGYRKLDQALLGARSVEKLYRIVKYYVEEHQLRMIIKPMKTATSRIKLRKDKLRNQLER